MISNAPAPRLIFSLGFILSVSLMAIAFQGKPQQAAPGSPVLWREPTDIASRNLLLGPGGEAMKPNLTKLTIAEEKEISGPAKFRVRDGAAREWVVKSGGEVQAEVAATRMLWAVGYYTDISYLAPRVEIEGAGVLQNAKFEARPKGVKRLDEWLWDDNPFAGTKEFQGLKVALALLDNWNLKNENTRILFVRGDDQGASELRYIISDFDVKLDKTGVAPSLWHLTPQASPATKLIEKVKDNTVDFGYAGKHRERLAGIWVEHARWIGSWLARLSNQQVSDALRAANYTPDEIRLMGKIIRDRINELITLR